MCGGGDKQATLAPANKAKKGPKTHLNKREIKLWFPQIDPKAVLSRSKSKNSKALKKMNKHNIKDYLEDIPCVVEGTSKLQLIFGEKNPHHQGSKRGPDQKHNSSPLFF